MLRWLFGRGGADRKGTTSADIWAQIHGNRTSRTGEVITWQKAIEVAAVLACVRVIANGVAQVPFRLYRETGVKRSPATEHPLHQMVARMPGPGQSSFAFRETLIWHLVLTGNAFVWLGRVGMDRRIAVMEIVEPNRMNVKRSAGGVCSYVVTADDGSQIEFAADQIWHLRGPSWNGWMGLDATRLARESIGLAVATETAHADFHNGSARVSGLMSMTNAVGKEKFEFLSAWLDRHSAGGDRAGKPLILDNGAKFTSFSMSGVDAQHLETRKFQIEEICRSFGVMPIMVGQSDKAATYASAEQMFLAHVVHTMLPWYERIEQSAYVALLSDQERSDGYYFKFSPNGLMRGAAKDRAEFYAKALGAGGHGTAWMVANEVRALEEMDPVEGGDALPAGVQPAVTEKPNGTD